MKIAFPDRLHGHQHRALDDAVGQGRNTQRASLAIGFGCGSACKRNPASGVIGVQKGTTIPMV
jgi:hypothetical protein